MRNYYYSRLAFRLTDNADEYILIGSDRVEYSGEWAFCKGDTTAQQEEEAQAQFTQQLMQIFQQQYANQSATLAYLQGKMEPIINAGGVGYTPEQLTALRTSASDTNAQQFQNAQAALQNSITANSGGSKLVGVSGAASEEMAALTAAGAEQEANSQNQITQANANLQQQNYWNAINVLNGVAAQYNPLGYSNSITGGSNAVAGLSQAVTASQQNQLLGVLGGVVGGMATGWATGGFKT